MDNPQLIISICVVFVVALVLFVTIYLFKNRKIIREDTKRQIEERCAIEFSGQELRATVVDHTCQVQLVGIKTPKATKIFTIVFRTEDGQSLSLNVPEEMYDGFEIGQTGLLTLVDGELYGFAPEE
jgi:hypothetical protein